MENGFNDRWTVAALITVIVVCVFITVEREMTPTTSTFEPRVFNFSYPVSEVQYETIE